MSTFSFRTEIRNNLLRVTLKCTDSVRVPNKYLWVRLSRNVCKFSSCTGNTWNVKDVDEMRALFWQFSLINKTIIIFLNYSTIPEHKYVITRRKTEHKQFITTVFDDRIAIVAHYIEFIEGIKLKFSYDNLSTIYLIECINYYSFIEDNRHISKLTMIS